MELKPGYKQTEVGVIPEDWELTSIGMLGKFSKGQGVRKNEASSGDIPSVRYGEIYTYHNDVIRSFNSWISATVANTSKRLKSGDILFAGSGETKEEIGKCIAFVSNEIAYAGGDIIILSPSKGDSKFLGYLFNAPVVANQKASKGQGDAVVHISSNALSLIMIPLPPTEIEQRAIAAALSDVDDLLDSLDRLIAKKRDIKQAAMQQLLTGKTRLPGFEGGWEKAVLKKLVETPITDGPHTTPRFLENGVPFLSVNNLIDNRINLADLRYISRADDQLFSRKCKPKRGDVLLGKAASVGKVAIVENDFDFNIWSPIALVRVNNRINAKFLYYQLQGFDCVRQIILLTNASSQGNIGMGDIEKLQISFPSPAEQSAIASVLSDMDVEVAALEQRRNKTKDIKQAMMQELLTGKTRLI